MSEFKNDILSLKEKIYNENVENVRKEIKRFIYNATLRGQTKIEIYAQEIDCNDITIIEKIMEEFSKDFVIKRGKFLWMNDNRWIITI